MSERTLKTILGTKSKKPNVSVEKPKPLKVPHTLQLNEDERLSVLANLFVDHILKEHQLNKLKF